ncbi:MAG: hypothetical protein RL642_1451 [Bacteroidota bacterium]
MISFEDAIVKGQAPDGGLYFPGTIPQWDKRFISDLNKLTQVEIAQYILKPYTCEFLSDNELKVLLEEVLTFNFPLQQINDSIYSLELFHGPTLAFKDLGARFLSRLLQEKDKREEPTKQRLVLVATSGDTGGAVADAFYEMANTSVVILYPSGKVSPLQEKQLTTYGKNIHAFEMKGDFDDCQRLVKRAFQDPYLQERYNLTSSNSINVGRWIVQQAYYAFALSQWSGKHPPAIAVPSGNFGNLCAGLLASKSGLPAKQFIAACNSNAVFTDYIRTGKFEPKAAVATLSNAMDVGHPNNAVRIFELYNHNYAALKNEMSSYSIADATVTKTIHDVYIKHHYLLDPHSAVAFAALEEWIDCNNGHQGIIMSTAHPYKFQETVEQAIQEKINTPKPLTSLMQKKKISFPLAIDYESFVAKLEVLCN